MWLWLPIAVLALSALASYGLLAVWVYAASERAGLTGTRPRWITVLERIRRYLADED